ncbi:hypothetical protein ACHSBP_09600 [Pseudoalteromonas sp. XMcav1-K]|uniref:hypothetical protein n=1 Tax=Pseudoalteromonas sp. XMcav1-K TaxID=3374372 RepID=UPI003757DD9B
METFQINSKQDAKKLNLKLNTYWKKSNAGSGLEKDYFCTVYKKLENTSERGRVFSALIDLEMTYLFMAKDVTKSGGGWNQNFAPGKLEGGSVLDDYNKFQGKVDILDALNSFTFRSRAFWDKYMGILVLIKDFENYQKYCKAKSRKKNFKKIASEWTDFPIEVQEALVHTLQQSEIYGLSKQQVEEGTFYPANFLDVLFTYIEQLDNQYRTPEAHGTGALRKWSLSMLPIEHSRDFDLLGHWNIVNSMIRGLREYLVNSAQIKS